MAPASMSRRACVHSRFRMSIGAQTISRPPRSAASISSPACAPRMGGGCPGLGGNCLAAYGRAGGPEALPGSADAVTGAGLEGDRYPIYAGLRGEGPVCCIPGVRLWFVARYDGVGFVGTH